ncbi:MAG: NAD(P)/FAD-dependent oxidoreductase [Candidatus Bathyarchaeota archaeon]|nr:NAD(P)/FAD-dependent oxidoreductase [Candidatus Bathyarchaeota archaeon]
MEQTENIVIVGGGPAGAYCALELSKHGVHPTIFDHSHPREKPCGGGISPIIIKKFPFLENFRSEGFTFPGFKLITCTNHQVSTNWYKNGFGISRRLLDEKILEMATKKGSKLIKEKVIKIQKKGNKWIIKTKKRVLLSKILVGADGVNSIVRLNTVGSISNENLALTYGYLATSNEKKRATIKYMGEIPGYIWVFPRKNCYSIGIGSELRYGGKLRILLDDFISQYCPNIKIFSKFAAMLPSANNPKFFSLPSSGKNWILIGDAAGHVDPISGGGILYALWGAKLAAKAIIKNDLQAYDKLWKKEYGNKLKTQSKKKDAFYDPVNSTFMILLAGKKSMNA